MSADAGWESDAGTGLRREELAAMGAFRYADGTRMERGDTVWLPARSAHALYRIIGWDPMRGRVVLRALSGGAETAPAGEVSRW